MKLKVRLAAIASALALAGGLTLAFAGPASAALSTGQICTYAFASGSDPLAGDLYCADHVGSQIAVSLAEGSDFTGASWEVVYNGAEGGSMESEIRLANTSECMAVTKTDTVEVATCTSDNSPTQLFVGFEESLEGDSAYPVIVFQNEKTDLCLATSVSNNDVRAETCPAGLGTDSVAYSPNEDWFLSTLYPGSAPDPSSLG